MAKIEKLLDKRHQIAQQVNALQGQLREIDYQISLLEQESWPEKDGWYLDANDTIARRENGVWHDGWGNYGPDYDTWTPPFTRLVKKSKNNKEEK